MLVAQIDTSFLDRLWESFAELGSDIGNFVPRLLAAILVFVVGRWIAGWVRRLAEKGLGKLGVDRLAAAGGVDGMLRQAGTTPVRLIAQVLYYLVLLVFLQVAAEVLGIDQLTSLLSTLIGYLPLVIVAIAIMFVAGAIANWVARMIRPFAESRGLGWIDNVARWAILVIGFLAAMDTLNFAPEVMTRIQNTLLQYLPLSVLIAGTIAFGVGGIETAREWWRRYLSPKGGRTSSGV